MLVTQIKEINKKQYKITLDYEFSFVIYKGELNLYKITCDSEIPEKSYEELINKVLPKRAKLRAMNLLKVRPYTEKELRDKLYKGGYPKEIIDIALNYVSSFGYINDEQYAHDYINTYKERKNKIKIFTELSNKGISKNIIEIAYEEEMADEEENLEEKQILKYLKSKNYNAQTSTYEEKTKILAALFRKGYSVELAKKLLDITWDCI